ncbi:Phosphoserine phosphatase RsbU [Polystyrenella longa]|uniref:Phosphoserine phosphatase RsbU n=1 Tax=Polystyrenella longa TaxID=2528007 RepID=A0A518CJE6_9PLAN|nr:PP2C family protein-serine/threonine phosphatase [Polystyrenella longa]QDU79358.1 Phosphoserine phosphatase RsbU [Polystyrenella longa]
MSTLSENILGGGTWQERLNQIVATMQEMSKHTDPQEMVQAYSRRIREMSPGNRIISLSRRDLDEPWFRVTRYSEWTQDVNPWHEVDSLPMYDRGLFSELIYGNAPKIIDDLVLEPNDPAYQYLEGQGSLIAVPQFENGNALNMTVFAREGTDRFDPEQLPEFVWVSNLFGRATSNLVMAKQLSEAYAQVDFELKRVAEIQHSLLPASLPEISNLKLAAHYETSQRAGGDYYDFFPLPNDKWGILIADVSGHGTPAAVMMAVLHSIAHSYDHEDSRHAAPFLDFVNKKLCQRYTEDSGTFVTAFYAIYDPHTYRLTYSSAGHNPPRLRHCDNEIVEALDQAQSLPLGVIEHAEYHDARKILKPNDRIIFYTDGIVEAGNHNGVLFGEDRLDSVLAKCKQDPQEIITDLLEKLKSFTSDMPPLDDRTLLTARVL